MVLQGLTAMHANETSRTLKLNKTSGCHESLIFQGYGYYGTCSARLLDVRVLLRQS